ncbi:hypothetical protein [Sulfitobacter sp.]|uniref:hypothetical protein n=1 Tax=Sulfitobacter sp. TaxID=1903071 RepID=UPI003566A088
MSRASLSISVVEKRMKSATEAAHYCGLAVKHFKALCPVRPIVLQQNNLLYDKIDLDRWIDAVKSDAEMQTQQSILAKLA